AIAKRTLHQTGAVNDHAERAAHVAVRKDRIGLRGIAVGPQVEAEIGVDAATERVDRELFRGPCPLDVVRRDQLLADIRLIGDDLLAGNREVARDVSDQTPARSPAETGRRIW